LLGALASFLAEKADEELPQPVSVSAPTTAVAMTAQALTMDARRRVRLSASKMTAAAAAGAATFMLVNSLFVEIAQTIVRAPNGSRI